MSNREWPHQIFVTGTDTGIGKTVVSAIFTEGLKASYWKPIQAGLEEETDSEFLKRVTGEDCDILPERYRLQTPMSPHAAAAIDDVQISLDGLHLPAYKKEHLVVEGAGGLMVPINDDTMIIDLIEKLHIPVVLVARSELGTLNHTFLSLEALRSRSIPILGVVMNGPKNESNYDAIKAYGEVDILAEIEHQEQLNANCLNRLFREQF
ncbi:dethiobiotin synthase [Fodinibius salsisoli]|uniref:ATP-dependent dethiobiotin synthetase BioD n=1 Tax=Fodinibius salsisoli TaxID=2820877 RepID=A0ABT3PMN7_9BACT|nr:dethiobiotin synthase [Fodinibius salsisoli]MCW9707206.1 dethiobiotin synthase [Fodinibius salsisoli]